MQLQGLAVAVLSSSTGKIRKGMNTFNFGETVEKATPQSQTSNFYGLQQMQFNRALKHIEVPCNYCNIPCCLSQQDALCSACCSVAFAFLSALLLPVQMYS